MQHKTNPPLPIVHTHSRPTRKMAERDLARHCNQAPRAQRPDRRVRREANIDQVFRLVHLHRVPSEQTAEITDGDPPEPGGAKRAWQCPIVWAASAGWVHVAGALFLPPPEAFDDAFHLALVRLRNG
jgi:hypothetical protein